ncbi:MAG: hypothetical protein IT435_12280 [Phycisphaerales bacterium]|nr:hypothetical protein [Phycisphaerales bacterium]
MVRQWVVIAASACIVVGGCASKPVAEVSEKEMTGIRQSYGNMQPGAAKDDVLKSFKAGNKVKLGSASMSGADIEEWKVEAFHDMDKRKDMFVTFLYFCNGKLVDSSDSRIKFRDEPGLIDRWRNKQ